MNPIEKAFSKLKAHLRKIAERTVAALMRALETCADIFKPPNVQTTSPLADMIHLDRSRSSGRPSNRRFLAKLGASSARRQVEDRPSLGSRGG